MEWARKYSKKFEMIKNMGKLKIMQWLPYDIRTGQLKVSHWKIRVRHKIASNFMKITAALFILNVSLNEQIQMTS